MGKLVTLGKVFYAVSMIAIGVHQLFYGELNIMMMAPWPIQSTAYTVLAYAANIALIFCGVVLLYKDKARRASLILAAVLLVLFVFSYIPYEVIMEPYSNHLPLWTNALKAFAFAGGAFVIAGLSAPSISQQNSAWFNFLEKFIPYGHAFFCITMISFGLMHLLYIEHVSKIVPSWMPFPVFWTGITGVALIGAGLSIVARIKLRLVSNLLALMIFIWFWIIHVPGAMAMPLQDRGNLITSAFSALIFAGIALMIGNSPIEERSRGVKSKGI